jgi:hypothetical protein
METFGLYLLLVANLITSMVSIGLKAYAGKKGENLATKEDIGEITQIVKRIETDHAAEPELLKGRQQLRMAAIEKRLQAHQEAFTHWRKLLYSLDRDEAPSVVEECHAWWLKNCLYLEPSARTAFEHAYVSATRFIEEKDERDPSVLDQILIREFHEVWTAGNAILTAVELPPMSEKEAAVDLGRVLPSVAR